MHDYDIMYVVLIHTAMNLNTGRLNQHKYVQHIAKILYQTPNYDTHTHKQQMATIEWIRVIAKLPNSEQSYKGKVKTHNYINRQNQSTTGKVWKP